MRAKTINEIIVPIRDTMESEEFYRGIDEGIRFAVRILHASGFETCQSCQGGAGHACHVPTIDMVATGSDSVGFGALEALYAYGLPVSAVAIIWPVSHGLPYEKNWRITFARTMEDRADEKPGFIYGYRAQG